jgi:hypothetical protein
MPSLDESDFTPEPETSESCECQHCGESCSTTFGVSVCGEQEDWCGECRDDQSCDCERCDARVSDDDVVEVDASRWCQSCAENHSGTCDRCQAVTSSDSLFSVGDESWCEPCRDVHSSRCECCRDRVNDDHTHGLPRHGVICDSCYDDSYFTCCDCGDVCHRDNEYYDECSDESYCGECKPKKPGVILNYSDRTADDMPMLGDAPDGLYLGWELECESRRDGEDEEKAAECLELLGKDYAVAKHDGSLEDDRGFELVSCPATLEVHRKRLGRFFSNLPSGIVSWNTSGRCGFHVHASRAAISQLTIGKLLVFVNSPDNEALIVGIAGRDANDFCAIKEKKLTDGIRQDLNRYQALNTSPSKTIEFRIFRGSLLGERIIRNLEFVDCLIRFCRQCGNAELTVNSFGRYVRDHRKGYPALFSYLASRNLPGCRQADIKAARRRVQLVTNSTSNEER